MGPCLREQVERGRMSTVFLSPLCVLMTHAYYTHIPHAHETVRSVLCRKAIRELKRDRDTQLRRQLRGDGRAVPGDLRSRGTAPPTSPQQLFLPGWMGVYPTVMVSCTILRYTSLLMSLFWVASTPHVLRDRVRKTAVTSGFKYRYWLEWVANA